MSHVCGSFYRGLLPPSPRGDFARLVAPAPTSGPTRPTPGVPFVSRRKEPKACQGLRPLDPLGGHYHPPSGAHAAARRCRFPPEGLSTGESWGRRRSVLPSAPDRGHRLPFPFPLFRKKTAECPVGSAGRLRGSNCWGGAQTAQTAHSFPNSLSLYLLYKSLL